MRSGALHHSPQGGRAGGGPRYRGHLTYLFAFFAIVSGLFTPMATVQAAAPVSPIQLEDGSPILPPSPSPNQVVVVGDFQTAFGCGPWDVNRGATALQPDGTGFWSGVFDLPPGSYAFRIVTRSDIDRSLGRGGEADGNDLQVEVPEGVQTYFSFNESNGDIAAGPFLPGLQAVDDFGNVTQIVPAPGGGYEAYVPAQGSTTISILVDGNVVDSTSVNVDGSGYAHVEVDASGNIQNDEGLIDTTVVVSKVDENGAPVTGSCFAVMDGNELLGQACDESDGDDGTTVISFPRGVDPGSYDLEEVRTADGVPAGDDQSVDLFGGVVNSTVTVSLGGEEPTEEITEEPTEEVTEEVTEEPTEEETEIVIPEAATYALSLFAVDDQNNPLIGACYSIDGFGEQCDDDQDSVVTFTGLPNGSYTVTETRAPEGYNTADPFDAVINDGDAQYPVFHTAAQVDEFGTLYVNAVDSDGNLLPGACFTIRPRPNSTGQEMSACDGDDGSLDGITTFSNAVAGAYAVRATQAPDGYELGGNRNADVTPNGESEVSIRHEQIATEEPTEEVTEEVTEEPTEDVTEEATE